VKVPLHLVIARRERLAALIAQNGYLPIKELCRRLEVSEATARRDLSALEAEKRIKRTYGGAVSEFDSRFPSFGERREQARDAKAKIASAALSFIPPESTLFFDTGTTIYAIAEAFRSRPVAPIKIVTPSIPVGEILAGIDGVEIYLLSGQLLPRQSVLLGEMAIRSLGFWRFDLAFLSAEGMDPAGIWNSQAAIVEQQKAVLRRSERAIFCMDGSKLKRSAPHFLIPWISVDLLLTDLTFRRLADSGIAMRESQYCSATDKGRLESIEEGVSTGKGGGDLPVHVL
jgi:DeoR/GlpR family transcriptional regulator of sugar metabolism